MFFAITQITYDYTVEVTNRFKEKFHGQKSHDLIEFLKEMGISAERRSIYKDIEEINNTISQQYLVNSCRILHPTIA